MHKLSTSTIIYFGLVIVLAASNAVQVLLPSYQTLVPPASLPASIPVIALANAGIAIVLYGGLGFIGIWLANKLGFSPIWNPEVNNRQRFFKPWAIGAGIGIFIVILDVVFAQFNGVGRIQHPPFPSSIFASLSAGIGEELLFRLFFVSLWVWLISSIILKGKWQNQIFWIVALLSALVFAAGHIPSLLIMYNFKSLSDIPPVLYLEIILLNGSMSVFAAYNMKKYGFLASVGIHFWADIVFHVIWGLF